MPGGWIKLWRQSLDNEWLTNKNLWTFWTYCLLQASHKAHKITLGFQRIELDAGQFVFGRKQASKDLKMPEQTIRTCLKNLERLGNISVKSTNKYSLITVRNWETYQGDADEINQQLTSKSPTTNQQLTTNKNDKKVKNDKNKKIKYAEKVMLTPIEYQKLVEKFGQADADDRIQGLHLWKDSKGKTTKSDYSTILSWHRMEKKNAKSRIGTQEDFGGHTGEINL